MLSNVDMFQFVVFLYSPRIVQQMQGSGMRTMQFH